MGSGVSRSSRDQRPPYKKLHIVGFSRTVVQKVDDMVKGALKAPATIPVTLVLTKNEDFTLGDPGSTDQYQKILMICAYTERDNIMVPAPDVGELTILYEKALQKQMDVMVLYAGVPRDKFKLKNNAMAPDYERLLKTQINLRGLMEKEKFMAVSTNFKFKTYQRRRFKGWLRSEVSTEGYKDKDQIDTGPQAT